MCEPLQARSKSSLAWRERPPIALLRSRISCPRGTGPALVRKTLHVRGHKGSSNIPSRSVRLDLALSSWTAATSTEERANSALPL